MNVELLQALHAAILRCHGDPAVRVVVLSGRLSRIRAIASSPMSSRTGCSPCPIDTLPRVRPTGSPLRVVPASIQAARFSNPR
jgi:hypothetical protein